MEERVIKLKIHEESELYAALDPDQNTLSDEAVSYLTRCFLSKHRKLREQYAIEIVSDAPLNEEHVMEVIRGEFLQQKDDIRYGLKRLAIKEIIMGVIGIALLALWLYLSARSNNINIEILSIMSWVCIWEAAAIILVERPELLRMWKNLDRLIQAEIRFSIAEQ